MSQGNDSITSFYKQKLVDYTLDIINPKYRWAIFFIIIFGVVGYFFKGLSSLWLVGEMIVIAKILRKIKMQEAISEMAMEEIRYRIEDTNKKIVDVHTSIGYIYGERLGITFDRDFEYLMFLWKKKGLIKADPPIDKVVEIGYEQNDDSTYRIFEYCEDGGYFYADNQSTEDLEKDLGKENAHKIISGGKQGRFPFSGKSNDHENQK